MRNPLKTFWWRQSLPDLIALTSLMLFFVAMFPQPLFGGRYIFVGDGFFYSYPLRTVAWSMIRHGELPLWTPYVMSGYPLLSMAQIGLGYPLTWGYFFLPGRVAEQIYVLAPFLLAPTFTYMYLRELGRSSLASLFGALTFGYGGLMASPLADNGMPTNAAMWLPLILIALERSRRRPLAPSLLFAAIPYTMSILNGFGQGFTLVGLLATAYALFLVCSAKRAQHVAEHRWHPALVWCGAALLALGVAAFQILETMRVVRRSVRSTLSYFIFTQGSLQPKVLVGSILVPLYHVTDVDAYVPPLALALAIIAIYVHARRQREGDGRVFFWLAAAVVALILMMGSFTPFYRIIYHLPLLNRFRVPSRHTFEWTFAVAVLAAYGWDELTVWMRKLRGRRHRSSQMMLYASLVSLLAGTVFGILWWRAIQTMPSSSAPGARAPQYVYLAWKTTFVLLTSFALWRASWVMRMRWRRGLLLATLLVLCYMEPSALLSRFWAGDGLPASRFNQPTAATQFLSQFPPTENRVYTRVDLMSEQTGTPPRFDCANLSAVYRLQNVAGYEPLILERYSRALGGAWVDTVNTLEGQPDTSLLTERSHVLDILNTSFVVSYPDLATSLVKPPAPRRAREMEVIGELSPQATKTLVVQPTPADSMLFVTSLSNSTSEVDGQAVARVRIFGIDGKIIEREMQAGRDTAEWAHERPDVRKDVKHKLATPFDMVPVGGKGGFNAYRYKTIIKFDGPANVARVVITNTSKIARLAIFGVSLVDSRTERAVPMAAPFSALWQPVYEQHETLILRNTRALPRAWLVAEAAAVDGEEALRRIRGESTTDFDPRRVALLEVSREQLPELPGGVISSDSTARITNYEPNRLRIETNAPTATVLMVSEIFYPGWEATVDTQPAQIHLADYLLRGVALTAGRHTVEMRYTAPAARTGAAISVLTLLVLCGLGVWALRTRGRN